jgi:hypothetical protein
VLPSFLATEVLAISAQSSEGGVIQTVNFGTISLTDVILIGDRNLMLIDVG